jgi:hypothetical protein
MGVMKRGCRTRNGQGLGNYHSGRRLAGPAFGGMLETGQGASPARRSQPRNALYAEQRGRANAEFHVCLF